MDRLLQELERNLETTKLSFKGMSSDQKHANFLEKLTGLAELEGVLGQVKVYGRNVDTAGPIFSNRVFS